MSILEFLSAFRSDALDSFFIFISNFGDLAVLLPLICIIYWCISKSVAYMALFNFFITGSIVHGAKILFRIPRPWILNPDFKPVSSAIETASGYSFPSGHVQSASSIFLAFTKGVRNKCITVISYIVIALVMLSRMYLGVHTPLDVFTSLIISIIILAVLNYIRTNLSIADTTKLAMLIVSITYSSGLILYSYLLMRWNLSTIELVGGAIAFAASTIGFSIGIYIEDKYINFGTRCHSFFMQIAKIILGLGGMLLILYISSLIPAAEVITKSFAGFAACLWATCIFPLFIKLIQKKKYSEL